MPDMFTDPSKKPPPNCRRYQFTLAMLLFIAIPISILAGTWAGLIDFDRPTPLRAFHLLVAAAAPMGILIVISLIRALIRSKGPPRK
jgi:hypothetical protein